MKVDIRKPKTLHVQQQEEVSRTTDEWARRMYKFECPHLNCNVKFFTKNGMQIHAGRCEWRNEFKVDKIVGAKGPVTAHKYKIGWMGSDIQQMMTRGSRDE